MSGLCGHEISAYLLGTHHAVHINSHKDAKENLLADMRMLSVFTGQMVVAPR